jgi:predicted ATPase/DNA-binding SARP family transcriptional activator
MSKEIPSEPWLRFHFLGGCEISLPDGPVHLETAKTRALLVYLALNPGPQPRHRLMGLLWAELPEANARRNLRRALWNLRHRLSSPALPPPILSDRETVCFNREVAHWSDVAAFETACSYLEPASPRPTPAFHRDQTRRAAELYRGEFLQGFYVGDAAAFEEWALAERERLRAMALRALQHLVAGHAARNETGAALHYARRLLALEPWLEEAHAWLMRLLARSGRRAEALAQFEACKRVLAEELGVEPAQETQALYEQIRSGAFAIPASNLPAPTTPFVGRARELAEIAGLLSDPDCQLLTVTGLGGVGKTRLAREVAAQQIAAFAHGVHYVALSALGAAERIAAALAQSLDIPLVGTVDPGVALLAYLREKQMLLVLDGFEHLLEGATLPADILQAAPGVKILVTSRERLNLQGEWVYPLEGLECAPDGPVGDPASFDALRLFLQTARRVHLRFQVREGEDRHLARICSLVSGLPLAIELAAAWVRVLSLEEIAAEIARHLDFLATTTRDRPPRHRSIRAVFDHSWHLLSDRERDVFRKLSVFGGSFRPQEAGRVGGATLPILSALVDKSLLQRAASGRYHVHELLRQYAHEQLAQIPGEPALVRDLHCQVYAASVVHYHHTLTRGPQHQIVTLFAADMEDILAAWHWAVQQRNLEAVASMWRGVADYYQLRSSFREGEALFREALEALGWPPDRGRAGPGTLLSWELLSVQAMFALYLGRFPQARASLERCVALFARHGVAERVAHCQFFLGEIARFQGDHHAAGECYRQSLANYQQLGDRPAVGFCLNGLGLVSSALGELVPARSCFQASLAAFGNRPRDGSGHCQHQPGRPAGQTGRSRSRQGDTQRGVHPLPEAGPPLGNGGLPPQPGRYRQTGGQDRGRPGRLSAGPGDPAGHRAAPGIRRLPDQAGRGLYRPGRLYSGQAASAQGAIHHGRTPGSGADGCGRGSPGSPPGQRRRRGESLGACPAGRAPSCKDASSTGPSQATRRRARPSAPRGNLSAHPEAEQCQDARRPAGRICLLTLSDRAICYLNMPFILALFNCCGIEADVRVIDDAPLVFRGRVVTDGVPIFARSEDLRVAFETQTRMRYFDYLPIHRQLQESFFQNVRERGLHGRS